MSNIKNKEIDEKNKFMYIMCTLTPSLICNLYFLAYMGLINGEVRTHDLSPNKTSISC